MRDILKRELQRGDAFLCLTHTPKLGIVTESTDRKVSGVFVYFKHNPTKEQMEKIRQWRYNKEAYVGNQFELKFGKVSSSNPRKVIKLTLDEVLLNDIDMPTTMYYKLNEIIPEVRFVRAKEIYLRSVRSCAELAKNNQKIVVPKADRFI